MKDYITIPEAAEILDVSERTVRKYIKRNGWKTRLQDVRGDGYSTRKRVIAREDVLAENQNEDHSEAAARSTQKENLPNASQVRSTFRALQSAVENHTAAETRLAEALEDRTKELRRANRLRLLELALTIGIALGAAGGIIYALSTFPLPWP